MDSNFKSNSVTSVLFLLAHCGENRNHTEQTGVTGISAVLGIARAPS